MNKVLVSMPYIGKSLSVNYYKIMGKGGRPTKKTRPEVRIWMQQLADKVRESPGWEDLFGESVTVRLTGRFLDDRVPDLHNLHKVIADALEGALGIDDKYIRFEDLGYSVGFSKPEILMEIESG